MRYKSAQDIFDSVSEELSSYSDSGLVDTSKLIKIIKSCNAFLGLHINEEHEVLLDIKDFKTRLPNDFVALNFAVLCKSQRVCVTPPKGFDIEFVDKTCTKKDMCDMCSCADECGDFVIFQKCEHQFIEYKNVELVKVVQTSSKVINNGCFNLKSGSIHEIRIKDGWIHTNFEKGTVYLNYVGDMVDDRGDLQVIDHDLINPYYEASCIYHIYRILYSNHEGDELQRMQFWQIERDKAEKRALGVRNMPEYNELTELYRHNRMNFYQKYVAYFDIC